MSGVPKLSIAGIDKDKDMENFELLATLFDQGQKRGAIRAHHNSLQLAEIFIAVQTLTITNWVTGWWGEIGDLEPRMQATLDVMLNGCSNTTN
jgi:hypothetical protein